MFQNIKSLSENKSSEKNFGFVFAIFFLIIGLLPIFFNSHLRIWSIIVSLTLILISIFFPKILKYPNNIWFLFGKYLNMVISPIVFGFIFFTILSPIALIMKFFGKEFLQLKYNKNKNSYWNKKIEDQGTFKDQF